MSEEHWWVQHAVLMNEIHASADSFYTWKAINERAANDPEVLLQIHRNPAFWNTVLYGLQTTFIITIGRIFDSNTKSNSIKNLLSEMVAHPEYFSKTALERRKLTQNKGGSPSWLPVYMRDAWEPSKADLEQISNAMQQTFDKYKRIYKPIRDKIFAHRDIGVDVQALLGVTLISEVEAILYDVRDTLEAISSIYMNGLKPRLGHRKYENEPLSTETMRLLTGLHATDDAP